MTKTYYTRFSLKLKIPATNNPITALSDIFQDFMKELQQADPDAAIHLWKKYSSTPILTPQSETPTSITLLAKYLHRVYLPKKGESTTVYPMVYMGHYVDFDDIREAMRTWLTAQGYGMYYNMLQVEDGVDAGWLLYSTKEMDAGALADEISSYIGVQVGLQWKTINTG